MSIPRIKRHKNGIWYIHWAEGRRTKRLSLKTYDPAVARVRFAVWLNPALLAVKPEPEPAPPTELMPDCQSATEHHQQDAHEVEDDEPIDPAHEAAMRHAVDQIDLASLVPDYSQRFDPISKGVAKTSPCDRPRDRVEPESPTHFVEREGQCTAGPVRKRPSAA